MTEPFQAVFLSYASQDAESAQRIAATLHSAGVQVWFDRSELRGGEAWDQTIRQRVRDCRLFVPIISANTEARSEGYFRREWKLAVDRTNDMSERLAFIVPVVIDATLDASADVPQAFRSVQWTRLAAGDVPAEFVKRIQSLLTPKASPASSAATITASSAAPAGTKSSRRIWNSKVAALAMLALVIAAIGYPAVYRFIVFKRPIESTHLSAPSPDITAVPSAAFNPPPHSIAVLPFVNMGGDKEQEYFSDGLTEELLNSLVRINELQVAARTSSFSFKGKDIDIAAIARKLNVGAILEGTVRRGGRTIRVSAELTNAVTGFHLWSQTYDRPLSDVLQLQTDIANAVTSSLKIAMLGNIAQKVEMGGTHDPGAFDAYLRASKLYRGDLDGKGLQQALASYSDAIKLDPDFAMAYADRSLVLNGLGRNYSKGGANRRDLFDKAQADASKAIALVPDLAAGHLASAYVLTSTLDYAGASAEFARAVALAPGDAGVLRRYGQFAVLMGHTDVGLDALRRAVTLDPLNSDNYYLLGEALTWAHRATEALIPLNQVKTLDPADASVYGWLGYAYLSARNYQNAKEVCEHTIEPNRTHCLIMAYDGLGRHADAEAMLQRLISESGEDNAIFIAMIYAQRRDPGPAFDWLDKAVRVRDPYLEYVKTNTFFDPLRNEPRFKAIEHSLKFVD